MPSMFRLRFAFAIISLAGLGPIAFGSDGPAVVERQVRIRPIHLWTDHRDWVTSLCFLKDGGRLCVGTYEEIVVRHPRKPKFLKKISLQPGYVKSLALSPDGKTIAAAHYQSVSLLDTESLAVKQSVPDIAGYATGVAFSPDGRMIAVACEDQTATLRNVSDGKIVRTLEGHSYPVLGVAFSPDGKRVATAAGDETRVTQPGEVKVWSSLDGKQLFSFKNPRKAATAVAFSPDGKWLASTGYDERVILYDLIQGKAISFFGGHSRPTNAVLFARGGEVLISASGGRAKDGNDVRVWERETGTELALLSGHTARVSAIALSPDATMLASGGYDKAVALWNLKAVFHPASPPETAAVAATVPQTVPKVTSKTVAKATPMAVPNAGSSAPRPSNSKNGVIRIGLIGLDTSHAGAFTKVFNDPHPLPDVAGFHVVAAYPRGSADIESSASRIPKITKEFQEMGIEIVGSVEALLPKVDVVLLETNDGRPHLEQALAVMKSGKRLFIDKPIAASLTDAVAIFEAGKRYHVPLFSSSALRFGTKTQQARRGKIGLVVTCETISPCMLEKTHPDLFWYGIHGVESLFTVMGTGCQSVRRSVSTPTEDVVIGSWADGRTGTFHGVRGSKAGYGGTAKGPGGTLDVGKYDGYRPLVVEIAKFFKTGTPPVSEQETLEIYAFMEAADESKRRNGAEVTLPSVLAKARQEAAKADR